MSHEIGFLLSSKLPIEVVHLIVRSVLDHACVRIQSAARRYFARLLPARETWGFLPVQHHKAHACYRYDGTSSPAGKVLRRQLCTDLKRLCLNLPAGEYALLVRVLHDDGRVQATPSKRVAVGSGKNARWSWFMRHVDTAVAGTAAGGAARLAELHVWVQ